MEKRVHYIDIAKGILMLLVIWGHLDNAAKGQVGINNEVFSSLNNIEKVWVAFFMPSFFIITGYCSNFQKKFIPFLKSNIKGIIVPLFFLSIILHWADLIAAGDRTWFLKPGIKGIVQYGGSGWFLSALFVSKMIYWVISHFFNKLYVRILFCLVLQIIGILIYNNGTIFNFWYFQHSFMLTIFLAIGQLRKSEIISDIRYSKVMVISYIGLVVLMISCYIHIPYISLGCHITLSEIPILYVLSYLGHVLLIWLAKIINRNYFLEYLGKNSLVIYMVHFSLYILFLNIIKNYLLQFTPPILSCVCFFLLFVLVVLISCIISYILNFKYLRILIGKY